MTKHSMLSPSSSKMWISCPPSALKNAESPEETSDYAEQGTQAHIVAEETLKRSLGIDTEDSTSTLSYYDAEMQECADGYAQFVGEELSKKKDPLLLTEQRVDISMYADQCFGTADCLIISDGNLHIIDYKYGQGVPVSAGSEADGVNTQLAMYAAGALNTFDSLYDIETVSMSIYQPRLGIAETYTIPKEDLMSWVRDTLIPRAALAAKGEGEFAAGDHCRFCKYKAKCRKRAEYNLELARYDFAKPDSLEDDEIEAILAKVDDLVSWANDVKEYALTQALSGHVWNSYKLVAGRSVRKYTSEEDVAKAVEAAGYDPYECKVMGITAMTKLLGKVTFNTLLGDYIEKPAGKPTLVPRTDKRKELNAKTDFEGGNDYV